MQCSAQIVARVPPDLATAFGLAARADGRSQSDAVREALAAYVAKVADAREDERAAGTPRVVEGPPMPEASGDPA